MSIKHEMQIRSLIESGKAQLQRLDKLEKALNTLKKSVSHIERHGLSDGGVVVPQTALPETLDALEIGSQPKGT
jgi:hypothetical protein